MKSKKQDYQERKLQKLRDENGILRKRLSSFKKENKNLQESLKSKNSILDTFPTGILITQQRKIVDINKTALEILGYAVEEALGPDFLDLIHPHSKAFVKRIHQNRLAGKFAPEQYEVDFIKKNGDKIGCDVKVKKFHLNRRIAFFVSLSRAEERKMKEKELIQSKKAEVLNTMSLGLVNTLRPRVDLINRKAQQVRHSVAPECKVVTQGLNEIEEASRQIMDTVHHLDGLCKLRHDHTDLALVDLKKIVKDAIALTNQTLGEKAEDQEARVNFKTYLRSVSPVEGAPKEIKELVARVIMNAVEAMPTGGDLYISTEETGGYAHIYVQDNGSGIPRQIEDRILDPFFTTKARTDCGLGLSLCSAIVKRHNGSLEITCKENHGTMVTIKLPLASLTKQRRPNARSARRKLRNSRILIIEDDDMIREILSQLLGSKGYRVITTVTGSEALNQIRRKEFDMVIIGSETPDIAGHLLAAKIKKADKKLPLALVVGPGGMDKVKGVKKSAADLIIRKPIDMSQVVEQISDALVFSKAS